MSKSNPTGNLPLFQSAGEEESTGPAPRARRSDPDTSKAAAASMKGEAGTQRWNILNALYHGGPPTADALDESLGLRVTSAGRRMSELQETSLVRMLREKGPTRSGRSAHLWEITEAGRQLVALRGRLR